MIDISIVICTFNRAAGLERTLRSLAAQTLPADRWEAVVVNNNSTDDTAAVFARFAAGERRGECQERGEREGRGEHEEHGGAALDVRMVDERRQGLSWARNRGLAEARGEIVVMIDDDEVARPGFLEAYHDFFEAHPAAVAAGGPMVAVYEAGRPRWMSRYTEALAASTIDLGGRVRQFPRGRYPIGGNMAFRREIFARVGVFDTSLGRTGEGLLGGEGRNAGGGLSGDNARNKERAGGDRSLLGGEGRNAGGGISGDNARNKVRGGGDKSLLGGEEKDLFMRIAGLGGGIWWVPGAAIDHLIPPERLTDNHFRRLSRMVGVTARTIAQGGDGERRGRDSGGRVPNESRGLNESRGPNESRAPKESRGPNESRRRGAYTRALIAEVAKWGATLLLAAWFVVTLRPAKSRYLIIMRCQITVGLISGQ